jgi:hypothetical protein
MCKRIALELRHQLGSLPHNVPQEGITLPPVSLTGECAAELAATSDDKAIYVIGKSLAASRGQRDRLWLIRPVEVVHVAPVPLRFLSGRQIGDHLQHRCQPTAPGASRYIQIIAPVSYVQRQIDSLFGSILSTSRSRLRQLVGT